MGEAAPHIRRAGFIEFASLVVVADGDALEQLADRFMADDGGKEGLNAPITTVTQPLVFAKVAEAQDRAKAHLTSGSRNSTSYPAFGRVYKIGGGFEVTYVMPIRVMQGQHAGHPYSLEVAADDTARFHHREEIKNQDSRIKSGDMDEAFAAFMAAVDRPMPANVTFEFPQGD